MFAAIFISVILAFVAGVAVGVIYHSEFLKFIGNGVEEIKRKDSEADE